MSDKLTKMLEQWDANMEKEYTPDPGVIIMLGDRIIGLLRRQVSELTVKANKNYESWRADFEALQARAEQAEAKLQEQFDNHVNECLMCNKLDVATLETVNKELATRNKTLRDALGQASYHLSFNTYHAAIKAEEIINKALAGEVVK